MFLGAVERLLACSLRSAKVRRKVLTLSGALALALATVVGLAPRPARACATAPPVGEWVRVATESAVIVWDAAAKREHFIRRASFRGTSKDFGFLVPTPSKPELAEISNSIFDSFGWATRPRVQIRKERGGVELGSLFLSTFGRSAAVESSAAGPAVRVLDEATVAGYDAVVLEADDPAALAAWLASHGYDARPTLVAWLEPYVTAKWKITAFKVASPRAAAPTGTLGTQAVRMSFDTETPFFPYREPADQREPVKRPAGAPGDPLPPEVPAPRELLVYLVSAQRMTASIGKTGAFPGSIPFAKHLGSQLPADVGALLADNNPFVTVVVDPSTPRPGTDELYFSPSGDQSEVEPPPIVQIVREPIVIPVEGVVLLAGIVGLVLLVRGKKRAAV